MTRSPALPVSPLFDDGGQGGDFAQGAAALLCPAAPPGRPERSELADQYRGDLFRIGLRGWAALHAEPVGAGKEVSLEVFRFGVEVTDEMSGGLRVRKDGQERVRIPGSLLGEQACRGGLLVETLGDRDRQGRDLSLHDPAGVGTSVLWKEPTELEAIETQVQATAQFLGLIS